MKVDQEPSRPRPSSGILHAWLIAAFVIAIVWALSITEGLTPGQIQLDREQTAVAGQ